MPPRLPRPTNVPGDHAPLINMLWRFYVVANGPSMRKVAQVIAELEDDQRDGTANHETIRRTLGAMYLPQWQTVEVIFLALCRIADVDPDDDDDDDDDGFDRWETRPRTHRERLQRCYRLARYGTLEVLPRTRDEKARQEAEAAAEKERRLAAYGGFADEPPF